MLIKFAADLIFTVFLITQMKLGHHTGPGPAWLEIAEGIGFSVAFSEIASQLHLLLGLVSAVAEKTILHQIPQYHTGHRTTQGGHQCSRQGITGFCHFRSHKVNTHGIENGLRAG